MTAHTVFGFWPPTAFSGISSMTPSLWTWSRGLGTFRDCSGTLEALVCGAPLFQQAEQRHLCPCCELPSHTCRAKVSEGAQPVEPTHPGSHGPGPDSHSDVPHRTVGLCVRFRTAPGHTQKPSSKDSPLSCNLLSPLPPLNASPKPSLHGQGCGSSSRSLSEPEGVFSTNPHNNRESTT